MDNQSQNPELRDLKTHSEGAVDRHENTHRKEVIQAPPPPGQVDERNER